jgi:hypothetical protein
MRNAKNSFSGLANRVANIARIPGRCHCQNALSIYIVVESFCDYTVHRQIISIAINSVKGWLTREPFGCTKERQGWNKGGGEKKGYINSSP